MTTGQPDYEAIARQWDDREYLREPVAEAIAKHLPARLGDALVLDMACGAGEPGFTVKAHHPTIRLTGVDTSEAMIQIARSKAAALGLDDVSFEVGDMRGTGAATASVSAVVSRYGLLYADLQDVRSSLAEAARVLRPGGAFSLAVWDRAELNTTIVLLHDAMSSVPGSGELPDPFAYDVLAVPGRRPGLLREAGFDEVEEAAFSYDIVIPGHAALLTMLHTSPYGPVLSAFGPAGQSIVEERLTVRAADHLQTDGSYRIPHTCRLLWGRR